MSQRTSVHETAFIGPGVELGERVTIGPYAVLLGPAQIGDDVWIGPGTTIGAPPEISSLPQNPAWQGDLAHAGVLIGEAAVIREQVVIHQGSHRATTVGPGSWILNRSYLAHDVVLGHAVTVSAGVSVGGHCTIGAAANLGMNASVHQRRVVGAGAMLGMGTPLTRDLPPFAKAYGSPPRMHGLNLVGMTRFGLTEESITQVTTAYEQGDLLLATIHTNDLALLRAVSEWQTARPEKLISY